MEHKIVASNFETEVLHAELPVLVDFYADWCGPCKMMAPVVEQFAGEYEGRLKVGKCNIDENMALAQKYRVLNIPTFVIFKDGKVIETLVGTVALEEFRQKIENCL